MTSTTPSSLQRYRRNIYSQNGEDGVIAELVRRLQLASGWFCEFGAWDGKYGSNCYALLRHGWSGVMIEGDHPRFEVLKRLAKKYDGRLYAIEAFVEHEASSPHSLDNILRRTTIPRDFEVLSIDIDGFDYQVWSTLETYRPLVIIIEINSSVPPGPERIHGDNGQQGTTFSAMLELGRLKGYDLVAHTGNMIFVRSDQIEKLGLPPHELEHPEKLFVSDWVSPTRLQVVLRKIRHMTAQRALVKLENLLRGDLK